MALSEAHRVTLLPELGKLPPPCALSQSKNHKRVIEIHSPRMNNLFITGKIDLRSQDKPVSRSQRDCLLYLFRSKNVNRDAIHLLTPRIDWGLPIISRCDQKAFGF